MRLPEHKIVAQETAEAIGDELRKHPGKIVSTNGCFDLLHLGHLNYLREAKQLGSILWVGLNSDASVRRLKGDQRPILDERTRAHQLAALEAVDFITIFEEDTPDNFLKAVKPHIHVKGGDYATKELPERKIVESHGGKVVCLSLTEGFSTTDLIAKIKNL